MAAPKGTRPPNAGRGRIKGVPNKATAEARAAIAEFLDNNLHRLQSWLDAIAKDNPAKAFSLVLSLLEYHVPKLSHIDPGQQRQQVVVLREFGDQLLPLEPPKVD
jgi:hypothetical protein